MAFKVGLLSYRAADPQVSRTRFIVLSFKNNLSSSIALWKELNF